MAITSFAKEFQNWNRLLALAGDADARVLVFADAARDAARFLNRGLDRAAAADELTLIANAHGLDDVDKIQSIIAREFERSEDAKPNGKGRHTLAPLPIVYPFPIDEASLPIRNWAIPGFLLHRHLTVLVAPSGSGKSLLTLQVGIACAQGKAWAGWIPRKRFRVLVINSEDDIDEMRRRLAAAANVMQVNQVDIARNIMLLDNSDNSAVVAKFDVRTKTLIRTPLLQQIIDVITANEIDIVFVDPFAETFEGDENSNSELKWAGIYWREVARKTGAAICLVHHTKKYASGMAGDVDAARGAGALIGIARIVSTLFPMTNSEAEAMGIKSEKRPFYLRYDDAKANLNVISPFARWFRKDTVILQNATKELAGDEVGALVPWKPNGISLLEAQIMAFFAHVDQGIVDDDGKPTGEFYTFEKAGRNNERYIGFFAQEFFKLEALKQAEELITTWKKAKRLRSGPHYKTTGRKLRARVISELNPLAQKEAKSNPEPQEALL
jgi:AAA domain